MESANLFRQTGARPTTDGAYQHTARKCSKHRLAQRKAITSRKACLALSPSCLVNSDFSRANAAEPSLAHYRQQKQPWFTAAARSAAEEDQCIKINVLCANGEQAYCIYIHIYLYSIESLFCRFPPVVQ